jgi:RHS repeat-associated protein
MLYRTRFFLLLFLIPSFIYASHLHQDECEHLCDKALTAWNRSSECIEQLNRMDPNQPEPRIPIFERAIAHCQQAIGYCDKILNDIAKYYKKHSEKRYWHPAMKERCKKSKEVYVTRLGMLQNTLTEILSFEKAKILYAESIKKADLAQAKIQHCPRYLDNIDTVVATLTEIAQLYEEAASAVHEALTLISPFPREADKALVNQTLESFQAAAHTYRQEAADWPASVADHLKEQRAILKEESQLLTEKGFKLSSYEVQKRTVPILEQLIEISLNEEREAFKEELAQLRTAISACEKEADRNRLTYSLPLPAQEEFQAREKEGNELFFKSDFLLNPALFLPETLKNTPLPRAIPLDGQRGKKEGYFVLYTEQFYRFLVQSNFPVPELCIKVHDNGELVHVETIPLPFKNTHGWERYLRDGMIFIPETKLKSDYGLDLRLSFACNPKNQFSMIVAQKSTNPRYHFSIALDQESSLCECHFSPPPPWQLEILRKPALLTPNKPVDHSPLPSVTVPSKENGEQLHFLEILSFPVLDQLVEELKGEPLALAGYVQNEIALVDPYLHQENGVFHAPGIHRNPGVTYLEGQGSPWEQCQLLVYLLRKAGYQAVYALGGHSSLPKDFVEKMLFTKLPEDQKEALLKYPWVVFFDGKEWISLFPWMKEIQVHEGHDLYSLMPEEYATANRWILRYLKRDEKILKWIDSDQDDTAGVLFVRFVQEEMRKQGLSLSDVGIYRTQLKKQFFSWQDFPQPSIHGPVKIYHSLENIERLFAGAEIQIYSHQNPSKRRRLTLPLAFLSYGTAAIHFTPHENNHHHLHLQIASAPILEPLDLDESDHLVDIKITCRVPLGTQILGYDQTFSIAKGTNAVLCSHFGGASSKMTSQFYKQFSTEKDEEKRLPALLSFVGAAYFEKCSRSKHILANLHKVNPALVFAFGLSKLSPDLSKGPYKSDEDLTMPQIDMFWFQVGPPALSLPSVWHQELYSARAQCEALLAVDWSSNEHQILREVFRDQYAISTVRLLQRAHQQQQKKGLEGEGFLSFTATSFEAADKTPEIAQSLYFPQLKDLNLRDVKAASPGQWNAIKDLLDPSNPLSRWSYAYLTPGLTWIQDGSYKEMGALISSPHTHHTLISNNNLIFRGGLGSPMPASYFTPQAIMQWQLVPTNNSYTNSYALHVPPEFTPSQILTYVPLPITQSLPGTTQSTSDVRLEHKSLIQRVADPVDTVTGAFYIDETDLVLPGSFPLEIRRNYNSQNPLIGEMGCGWKLSLNPFLIEQEGKRFAAEADGTVIVYSYNKKTSRWEVFPKDNPELSNFSQQGIGGSSNPFHAYIENDILYGSDGSKRFFEEGLLKKWVNAKGNTLTFSYDNNRLSRIKSSNGDFCGLHYNHEGNVSEIYAKDGRRISYDYNSQDDLVKVTLPNTAVITYDYDRDHRVIRETKPHGKVLENIYDSEGRVKEQRSPMGPQQAMITTATFDYADGETTVTDANEGKTTYKIFQKQIYKITDPLGHETLQSWFIDEESWFDPETEQILPWNQKGGAIRSLKSTTDKRGLTTYYLYNSRGNPEEIGLQGEDLTGSGASVIAKKLIYNDRDLCIEEEVCGQKTLTTYDETFPYLPKRVEKQTGNTLISYLDVAYNFLGEVEKEDHSGAITLWKYDTRGFPSQKTQVTGTDDPDSITTYIHNNQGQCIKVTSSHGTQETDHDIMGNPIVSKTFSPSGTLISATYIGYNLNSAPIWRQTANAANTLYLDYHASGAVKATRHSLAPTRSIAYTLYEYDGCGYLIEETDPQGCCTYRDYDAVGQVISETKEGHSTHFSYEPGGLLESITSPSGAKTTRHYTTNGLLQEEIYPDGTKSSIVCDFFGRSILETKNDNVWETRYDDVHHQVIRTHLKTQNTEISAFDARGNLIRFTDAAGYTSEKTYDGLNRIKTETTPSGQQTTWSYQGNSVICTLPSGEKQVQRYEGGHLVASEVIDAKGTLIARSSYHYDPETDIQESVQGDEVTTTWMNALGLPIRIQKGDTTTTYEYNVRGECIASVDGEGRRTRQQFDGLRRLVQKELPDASIIEYAYDLDSNLIEYCLPNGTIWKASYDSMRRKCSEEVQAGGHSSQRWEYTYEKGYLKQAKDPLQRTHTYYHDLYGRLAQESVDGWQRTYTYEPRGLLATAEQTGEGSSSRVERSYDSDGRLSLESIYLGSTLIQQTHQQWTPSSRSLQIGNHQRDFIYQNHRLVQVATQETALSYTYDLRGALKHKNNPLSATTIAYNPSGLPASILTHLPEGPHQEVLEWNPSGKLSTYSAPGHQQQFTYSAHGHLQAAGAEKYAFDFGSTGTGVRTAAPNAYVPQDGLDDFGKIIAEVDEKSSFATAYNPMGEVTSHNQRQFEWDPWGRLLKVTDPSSTWEASYDPFGRRLQTRYAQGCNIPLTTTSFYDPEEEFQEIGVQVAGKPFWKIYGPDACDALIDETGASLFLMHNGLGQLAGVVSQQGTLYSEKFPSAYGPQTDAPAIPTDLLSYAQSLNWHSKAQDPTGLIWMGARYYDPKGGRFLSPDPVSYPICLDLYTYANGDPINYIDPDGRFSSRMYDRIPPSVITALRPFGIVTPAIQCYNAVSACCANNGWTRSSLFQVGSSDLPKGAIGFINGINNPPDQAMGSAQRMSDYAQGTKIHGIYNATNSLPMDVLECMLGRAGCEAPTVQLLRNKWDYLRTIYGPDAKFLEIAHSGGATQLKLALLASPEYIRNQVIVVTFAPSDLIPEELCFESHNYMSRRDIVTHLDILGKIRYGNELHILEPHPDADFWDHDFLSPTFEKTRERHITDYIKNYGGLK